MIYVVLQVDFKCDVLLDTGPVTPKMVSLLTFEIISQELHYLNEALKNIGVCFIWFVSAVSHFNLTFFFTLMLQIKSEHKKKRVQQKVKQETAVNAPQRAASMGEISSPSPPLSSSLSSSPNSSSGAAPVAASVDQKKFAEAALKMVAEDMLPLRLESF